MAVPGIFFPKVRNMPAWKNKLRWANPKRSSFAHLFELGEKASACGRYRLSASPKVSGMPAEDECCASCLGACPGYMKPLRFDGSER